MSWITHSKGLVNQSSFLLEIDVKVTRMRQEGKSHMLVQKTSKEAAPTVAEVNRKNKILSVEDT